MMMTTVCYNETVLYSCNIQPVHVKFSKFLQSYTTLKTNVLLLLEDILAHGLGAGSCRDVATPARSAVNLC